MTDTNWPNPERPGVPLFPERDGWHLLRVFGGTTIEWWSANAQAFDNYYDPKYAIYEHACLTPTQISEMMAGERERAAKAAQRVSDKYYLECEKEMRGVDRENCTQRMLGAAECVKAIRNLGDAL